jgi:RNase P subunit RPR2
LEARLCSLEDILAEIERVKAEEVERVKSMEARRRISKSTYLVKFYCPKCLIRIYDYTNNELRTKARKGAMLKCVYCHEELRVVDVEFKKKYVELWESYRSKVEAVLRPVWRALRNWWIETEEEKMPCITTHYSVIVKFEAPSHLMIYIEGGEVRAYMYLHWLEPDKVPKLLSVVEALKNAKVKARIEVDPRPDHCTVEMEDMEKMGFKMGLFNWQLEIQP